MSANGLETLSLWVSYVLEKEGLLLERGTDLASRFLFKLMSATDELRTASSFWMPLASFSAMMLGQNEGPHGC